MQSATILRARVSPEAISKVSRLFNGTLDDIFNELLQNARRAGASAVAITTEHLDDACLITAADNGAGIADPADLVSLGQSDWSEECLVREDPAGMGFFSLAGLDTTVCSCSPTSAFAMTIAGDAWTGEADIAVLPWSGPHGTRVEFRFSPQPQGKLERTIAEAALHYPLVVTLNGAALPWRDFLAEAETVVERGGYRIGVYNNVHAEHHHTINFHGLTLRHRLPVIRETDRKQWSVRVDIVDAPELALVLPARKEVVQNAALDHLMDLCRETIFSVIRAQPFHRLGHDDWQLARTFDPAFPEAARELLPWLPISARDGYRETPQYLAIGNDAAIFDYDETREAVTFDRALAYSRGPESDLEAHRLLGPRRLAFFVPVDRFSAYPWYDAIGQFSLSGRTFLEADGSQTQPEADGITWRPHRIVLAFEANSGEKLELDTDFWIGEDLDCWPQPDDVPIALTRGSKLDPDTIADLIFDALFSPSDDHDSDSYATQEANFRHDTAVRAHAILRGEDAAILAGIELAFADAIAWRIPHGRTLRLSWSSEAVSLELSPGSTANGD